MNKRLAVIEAPHFVCGFETDGRVYAPAPIISYMRGWTDQQVRDYCKKKNWKVTLVGYIEADRSIRRIRPDAATSTRRPSG